MSLELPEAWRAKGFFQHPRKTMKNGLQNISSSAWLPPTVTASKCLPTVCQEPPGGKKPRAAEQALLEFGMDESFISAAPSGAAGSKRSLATVVTAASHVRPYRRPPALPAEH